MQHKKCTKCGEEKPATPEYFHKDSQNKSGLKMSCKQCVKAWYEANKESIECEIRDRGVTKISFPIEKFDVLGNFEGNFNGTVLSKIVSNLTDNVWVAMTDTGLVLNVVNPDYVLMYGQASQSQKRTVEVETH